MKVHSKSTWIFSLMNFIFFFSLLELEKVIKRYGTSMLSKLKGWEQAKTIYTKKSLIQIKCKIMSNVK